MLIVSRLGAELLHRALQSIVAVPEAVLLEVLGVEVLYLCLIHLILAQVHENLLSAVQVD